MLGRISYYVCRDAEDTTSAVVPVNQELYQKCIVPVMEPVFQLLNTTSDLGNLREAALGFFYNVADSIGEEFSVLLEKITEVALAIAEQQKGVSYIKDKKDPHDFSLDSDSENEAVNPRVVNVKIGVMDEKAAAIYALGSFAKACPLGFKPYWPRVLAVLEDNY